MFAVKMTYADGSAKLVNKSRNYSKCCHKAFELYDTAWNSRKSANPVTRIDILDTKTGECESRWEA